MSTNFKTGWIKDRPDARDRNVKTLLGNIYNLIPAVHDSGIADAVDLVEATPTPFDQEWTSSCVGQAGAGAIATRRKLMGMHNSEVPKRAWERLPSVRWLYSGARSTHDAQTVDEGTYIRGMCRAASFLGICGEDVMPWDPSKINETPSWNAYRAAYDQRWLNGYYRILTAGEERIKDIKRALTAGYPVVYGMLVDQQWQNYMGGILYSTIAKNAIGGHATFLYGYTSDGLLLGQNSWGPDWGAGGRYKIRQEALCESHVDDLTVIEVPPFDSGTV